LMVNLHWNIYLAMIVCPADRRSHRRLAGFLDRLRENQPFIVTPLAACSLFRASRRPFSAD
jgi:hypothetical protein